jgi:Domain of unknown function (DUF397)
MSGWLHAVSFCESNGSVRAWRKSSRSYGAGNCVEVATLNGQRVDVRDSTDTQGAVLTFSSTQWNVFAEGVRNGHFASYGA